MTASDMRRILFITKSPPYPVSIGGNQRSNLLYRALSRLGEVDILLVATTEDLADEQADTLRSSYRLRWIAAPPYAASEGCWLAFRRLFPFMIERVAHHARGTQWSYKRDPGCSKVLEEALTGTSYDMVVGTPLSVLAQTGALDHPCVVVDTHDLPTEYYASRMGRYPAGSPKRFVLRRHSCQLEALLPPMFEKCRAVFVAKASDRECPYLQDATVLPNIPFRLSTDSESQAPQPADETRVSLLFLAAFTHEPNRDGAAFLIDEVWPRVFRAKPDAKLIIAGSGLSEKLACGWKRREGVDVRGFVDDIYSVYAESAATVAPIFWGAGTNIKVVESLAQRRTCVVTPFGLRGYENDLKDGESLFVASTAEQFANRCIELLADLRRRNAMSERGFQVANSLFTFERFCAIVDDALRPLLSEDNSGTEQK